MKTYKVFRAGNSKVVAIPDELAKRCGFELGTQLIPQISEEGILYKAVNSNKEISPEFKKWLTTFKKRYGPALKELASK